jgi:cytochrome c1
MCLALFACGRDSPQSEGSNENLRQGKIEIDRAACGSCHVVPEVAGADSLAGPPLTAFGDRKYIAGLLPNTPDNLALWIAHPQRIAPGNAMPDMGLSEHQAHDIAAYLESLHEAP